MAILDEKYVLLTTLRKSGESVPTPVWVALLPDGTGGFTTEDNSGKVKRIRNNPQVTLHACTVRGKVAPGTPVVAATAEVLVGADAEPIRAAIYRKYSLMTKMFKLGELWRKVRRKPEPPTCAVRLTLS